MSTSHSVINADSAFIQETKAEENISDVYIGVFFDGTNNNMVRTAESEPENVAKFRKEQRKAIKKGETEHEESIAENDVKERRKENTNELDDINSKKSNIYIENQNITNVMAWFRPDSIKGSLETIDNVTRELRTKNIRNRIKPNPSAGYTNVAILYSLFDGEKLKEQKQNIITHHIYIEGSGATDITSSSDSDLVGLGFGVGATGVVALVSKAVRYIHEYLSSLALKNKDSVNIHFMIYGFSRGATCSRLLSYLITHQGSCGIAERRQHEFSQYLASPLYKDGQLKFLDDYKKDKLTVDFLGIYDTVASIGFLKQKDGTTHPLSGLFNNSGPLHLNPIYEKDCRDNWHYLNVKEYGLYSHEDKRVKFTYHICAIDEYRENFAITDLGSTVPPNCLEVFVPGCHSDIGGSYYTGDEEVEIELQTGFRPVTGTRVVIYGEFQPFYISPNLPKSESKELNKQTLYEMGWLDKNWESTSTINVNVDEKSGFSEEDKQKISSLRKELRQTIKINGLTVPCTIRIIENKNTNTIKFKRNVKGGYSNITLDMMKAVSEKCNCSCFGDIPPYYSIPSELKALSTDMQKKVKIPNGKREWYIPDDNTYHRLRLAYLHFTSSTSIAHWTFSWPFQRNREKTRFLEKNWGNFAATPNIDSQHIMSRIVYHGGSTDKPEIKYMYEYVSE